MPAEASAEAGAGERSAAPRPKTATVERRPAVAKAMAGYSPARRRQGYGGLLTRRSFSEGGEASVPRHKRVHARLDALWDARRLASAWYAALWRTQRVFCRAPQRLSALRPPSFGVSETKVASLGRRRVARTRWAV